VRSLGAIAGGGLWVAVALLPVLVFVGLMDPNGPLRGTRSPDPLPLPDATAGGLASTVVKLGFPDLAFAVPDEDRTQRSHADFLAQAPDAIRALHGRTVRLTGYMIPLEMEGWNVRRCVIVPSQANCCYGVAPRFCEFVVATMRDEDGVRLALDVPVTFTGTLSVGAPGGKDPEGWAAFYTLQDADAEPSSR
jgi:hypothetical protein